jgi:hypothetical protein
MKFNRLGAFTLGVVITAVSAGAVTYANAARDATLKACANKKTGIMRYIAKGSCNKKTETTLSWNQMGPQGLPGSAGIKGDAGVAGADGKNHAVKISELRTCGDDGATLCAVGVRGPGGGLIFYVDYDNQYVDFDYLEAAPTDADFPDRGPNFPKGGRWGTFAPVRLPGAEGDSIPSFFPETDDGMTRQIKSYGLSAGKDMTQQIILRHPGVALNTYAAGLASEYVSPTFRGESKSDWFLPSISALALMQANLIEEGLGNFTVLSEGYWSASPTQNLAKSWYPFAQQVDNRAFSDILLVRPIRSF